MKIDINKVKNIIDSILARLNISRDTKIQSLDDSIKIKIMLEVIDLTELAAKCNIRMKDTIEVIRAVCDGLELTLDEIHKDNNITE